MKTILMFPGQGSQYYGMGIELLDNTLISKNLFLKLIKFSMKILLRFLMMKNRIKILIVLK